MKRCRDCGQRVRGDICINCWSTNLEVIEERMPAHGMRYERHPRGCLRAPTWSLRLEFGGGEER